MSFDDLRVADVSVLQMRELEEEGILERFTRGWYWCNACGLEKPADYKYIEIGKMNPKAIICYDSACYLNGLLDKEPAVVKVATARTDRKKMEIEFPIKRYFLTNIETEDNIITKETPFGSYRYYSADRALFDSKQALKKVEPELVADIERLCQQNADQVNRYKAYFKALKRQQKAERNSKKAEQ